LPAILRYQPGKLISSRILKSRSERVENRFKLVKTGWESAQNDENRQKMTKIRTKSWKSAQNAKHPTKHVFILRLLSTRSLSHFSINSTQVHHRIRPTIILICQHCCKRILKLASHVAYIIGHLLINTGWPFSVNVNERKKMEISGLGVFIRVTWPNLEAKFFLDTKT